VNILREVMQFNATLRGFEFSEEDLELAEEEAFVQGVYPTDMDRLAEFVKRKVMERAN